MNRKSPIFLAIAILFVAVTMTATAHAATTAAPSGLVNINTADVSHLSLLPGVGAKAAQRIVDYRKEHGSFQKTTDLMQVKGVGEKKYHSMSPYLAVSGSTTLTAKVSSPRTVKTSKTRPSNTASK